MREQTSMIGKRRLYPNVAAISILALSLVLAPMSQAAPAVDPLSKVAPQVLKDLANSGQTSFLVHLKDQADISGAAALATKAEKGQYVFNAKQAVAQRSQPAVKAALDTLGVPYRAYYLVNMFWVKGDLA